MELLKQRILTDGKALSRDVLLVDSFLNHQVDMHLMQAIGDEFARVFAQSGATHVATIESSGIAPAAMTALKLNLPLIIMKKSASSILSEELSQAPVHSFTKGTTYQLTLKKRFLSKGDRVLFIDDFLANGEAALGANKVISQTGATMVGIGIVIEKAFQPGLDRLRAQGFDPVCLASVARMEEGLIEFTQD